MFKNTELTWYHFGTLWKWNLWSFFNIINIKKSYQSSNKLHWLASHDLLSQAKS